MKSVMLRQGDVFLLPCDGIPTKVSTVPAENGHLVLAHGEQTGHSHGIALSDRVALFREDGTGGGLFLSVAGDAPVGLVHQEHSTLPVSPGSYRVIRQRVWDAGAARRVAD